MAGSEFLDKVGVGILWNRMKEYVYECCCGNKDFECINGRVTVSECFADAVQTVVGTPSGGGGVRYIHHTANVGICNEESYGEFDISYQEVLDEILDGRILALGTTNGGYMLPITVFPYQVYGIYCVSICYYDDTNDRLTNITLYNDTIDENLRDTTCWPID